MPDHAPLLVYVTLNGLIVTLLALLVSWRRIRLRVPHGDGGLRPMQQAIRAHGNALEHVCLFGLILLAISLARPRPDALQWGLVTLFTASRLLHPLGMLGYGFNWRRLGAALTYGCEIAGLVGLIALILCA